MSFHSENFFREFQRFMDENGDYYADIQDALDEFTEIYNETIANNEEWSDDMAPETLSQMIMEETVHTASNQQEFIIGMEEALEVWPNNIDAKVSLIQASADNSVSVIQEMKQLLAEETIKWGKKSEQLGWSNHEERPYLRLKHSLAMEYFENSMYDQATVHFEEELELNENDNLGARYYLAAIFANTYQWDKLTELYHSNPYSKDELLIVFPMLVSAILKENEVLALELFEDLLRLNDYVQELLDNEYWPLGDIIEAKELGRYGVNSYEELCLACSYVFPIIANNMYVFDWLNVQFDEQETNMDSNIIAPDFSNPSYTNNAKNSLSNTFEFLHYANQNIFDGIQFDKVRILVNRGLRTKEDFAKKTEKQILSINQIGPVTVRKLKENGIVFKKKQ